MGRKPMFEFTGDADCPTCGAIPSKQKWKPRKRLTDISQADAIDRLSPVDAVKCERCGLVFSVSHYENDGTYVTDWCERETVPHFCPWCGSEVGK